MSYARDVNVVKCFGRTVKTVGAPALAITSAAKILAAACIRRITCPVIYAAAKAAGGNASAIAMKTGNIKERR